MQALIPIAQSFVTACWVLVGLCIGLTVFHVFKRKK